MMPKANSDREATDDLLALAALWRDRGVGVALATVTATWGSSPRPAGSQMLIANDGSLSGSVSGGCVEGAVIREALDVIADGKPRHLDFGITDAQAWEVGLACGGKLAVYVERIE